jgi:hypothetical protein
MSVHCFKNFCNISMYLTNQLHGAESFLRSFDVSILYNAPP